MAGINPATGRFDPYYYGEIAKPPADNTSGQPVNRPADSMPISNMRPSGTNWVLPVAGMRAAPGDVSEGGNWATGSFGYRKPASKGGHIHTGVDIYAKEGTAILAPVAGTITSVGYNSKGGHYVRMRGTDGVDYYFAHMVADSPYKQGTKVRAGIFLGGVGRSGNAAGTSAHLHFSMKKGGKAINPNEFLKTGRQQSHTPLSAIPGLNTPEEVQAWAVEESRRQQAAYAEMQGGFDPLGLAGAIQGKTMKDKGFGQSFMSQMMDGFSKRVTGGATRVPIPRTGPMLDQSSALGAQTGASPDAVPEAEATHPVMQRHGDVTDG